MEQQVFLVIYTLEEEKGSITYEDIAKKLNISEQLAGNYVTSIIEKGVPILKRYINSKPYLRLDPEFKTLQAKENILQLSLQEFGF
jgi:predicted DNA-binding transcriptional regulator